MKGGGRRDGNAESRPTLDRCLRVRRTPSLRAREPHERLRNVIEHVSQAMPRERGPISCVDAMLDIVLFVMGVIYTHTIYECGNIGQCVPSVHNQVQYIQIHDNARAQ